MLLYPTLPGLAYNVVRTPMQRTRIQESVSGYELPTSDFAYPRYTYELVYEVLREGVIQNHTYAEQSTLEGFFNQVFGSGVKFMFNDPNDNTAAATQFGVGDGATFVFQLQRIRGGGAMPVRVLNGAPSIFVNGVLKTVTTDYTVSSLGVVTFVVTPASGASLTWSGGYYWPARFNDDTLDFTELLKSIWDAGSVKLISVKI